MQFDESNVFFQELLKHVSTNPARVVPFIGAGLSRYGYPSNQLPGWFELIDRLRKHCDELGLLTTEDNDAVTAQIADSKYISVTELLLDRLGPPLFRQFIRRELDVTNKEIPPAIIDLVMISWSLIVTTNLDDFLEAAITKHTGLMPKVVTGRQLPELADAVSGTTEVSGVAIAKIHGTLSDAESWTLTSSHYRKLLTNPQYVEALKTLFMRRVFFVGFGLSDDDFDLVQSYLSKLFPEGVGDFFALVPESAKGGERLTALIRERGLKPIFYKVQRNIKEDPWNGHRGVGDCLSVLARAWAHSRSDLPVTMKYFPEQDADFVGRTKFLRLLSEYVLENETSVQVIGFGGEGKTTLVQQWLNENAFQIRSAGFQEVFGFSFYHASVEHFVNDAFLALCKDVSARSIWARLHAVKAEASKRPLLFVLDGLEAACDPNGDLLNPVFRSFIETIGLCASQVICTSRIKVNHPFEVIQLSPMTNKEATELLDLTTTQVDFMRPVLEQANGHALSLRIARSMADAGPEANTDTSLSEAEVLDPLHGNKLRRILNYYRNIVTKEESALLTCVSVFPGPFSYSLLELCCYTRYEETDLNVELLGNDLRVVVHRLLEKRLIVPVVGGQLSLHPNVRNFFGGLASPAELRPLHRTIARAYMEDLPVHKPETPETCRPFIDAAYHCAQGQMWVEFNHLFRDQLNRGWRNYLGNVICAWTDFRDLTTFVAEGDVADASIDRAYYAAGYARALKHLGNHKAADKAYAGCIRICAEEETPETARYLNNWLTHRIYSGDLDGAIRMVRWNYGLLDWPQEDYHQRWQMEHGDLSFGWLSGLLNDIPTALKLFRRSATAWEGFEGPKREFFDALSSSLVEFHLSQATPDFAAAQAAYEHRLSLAKEHNWPEAHIRALVSGAYLLRSRVSDGVAGWSEMDSAREFLAEASRIEDRIGLPTRRFEIALEYNRCLLDLHESGNREQSRSTLYGGMEQLEQLLKQTRWHLYQAEVTALKGRVQFACGNTEIAGECYYSALSQAKETKHKFAVFAPFQSIQALARLLETTTNEVYPSDQSEIYDSYRPKIDPSMLLEAIDADFSHLLLPSR